MASGFATDDITMEDDEADVYQESQATSPYLPAEIPDSQPDYRRASKYPPDHEIPDSQEDSLARELEDVDSQADFSSFHTIATDILPAPLQINKNKFVSLKDRSQRF